MNALRQFYMEIPIVTRAYTTVCVLTTLAVHLDLVSPLQLYFNPTLIVRKFQIWRLATTFLYFGTIGISFFFNMQAPYLPWVLLCCSMILGNTVWVDIIGMGVGHIYYVLEDVYPQLSNGYRLIKTPYFLKRIFNEHVERNYQAPMEDRPGGFMWGGDGQQIIAEPDQNGDADAAERREPPAQ
ncbi:Der-2 [Drosophila busckii]|uniref:Derlin n=1 Tax=Drosophila busckii TaxID=30019 RepID=A0A0M4EGK6_DROBS|nr:Der-2 [Drosophila busckii]